MAMTRCMECMEEYEEHRHKCPYCGCVSVSEPQEMYHLLPGSLLQERYLIGKALGSGSFGITYIGWDNVLVSKIAIKEYLPVEFSTRMPGNSDITIYNDNCKEPFQQGLQRFMEEAERLAHFRENMGIVRIFDTFEEHGTAYIVMEYLEGETLEKKLLREKKLSVEEAISLVIPIAETMKKVHAKGIIHRNISPSNIFLTNQHEVKIMDFGAARNAAYGITKSLSVIVKTGYAPEEQYRSKGNQGTWTDVYALAATFYRIITGILPENAMERTDHDLLKPPSAYGIDIPSVIECAIMNALKIDVSERTLTMEAFLKELKDEKVSRKKVSESYYRKERKKVVQYAGFAFGSLLVFAMFVLCMVELLQGDKVLSGDDELSYAQIPNLTGMTYDDAKESLKLLGVKIENVGFSHSNSIADDFIICQDVNPGAEIQKDLTVQVIVAKRDDVSEDGKKVTNTNNSEQERVEEKTTEVVEATTPTESTPIKNTTNVKKKETKKNTENKTAKETSEKQEAEKKTEERTTAKKAEATTEDIIVIETTTEEVIVIAE